jgi:ABC-type antimicrobial peptide transport system permease subunit
MQEFYQTSTVGMFHVIIGTVAAMGVMGLALSIVGLYGLVAYGAARRTKEIGIRIAIGATRGDVARIVMGQGTLLAAAGLAVGLIGSVGAQLALEAAFPGNSKGPQIDRLSLLLVAPAVLVVTALAAYLPARRASRIDPMTALRYE